MIQHSLTAASWDSESLLIQHRQRMAVLELASTNKMSFCFRIEHQYSFNDADLVKELAMLGTVLFTGSGPAVVTNDKFVLIPQHIDSRNKNGESTYVFEIWCRFEDADAIKEELKQRYLARKIVGAAMRVDWLFLTPQGTKTHSVHNSLSEVLLNEAYPYLEGGIDSYVTRYLESAEPVLILQGRPGTGKTRLIRYICQQISVRDGRDTGVMYTMDESVFSSDEFFLQFLLGYYDVMVLEDIDVNLKSRASGNNMMHKLLSGADGFVRNKNKKIILSTNLTNISDIDEALTRAGRCFDHIETRRLEPLEADALLTRLNPNVSHKFTETVAVSDVYKRAALPNEYTNMRYYGSTTQSSAPEVTKSPC